VLLDGIKIAREVAHSQALEGFTGEELMPGSNFQSKKELEEFVRQFGASAFHPTSSCKMGRDSMAVVDPELRVYGVAGLRVADASVMPDIVNSPPNATCIMIGEKAADFIKMAQVK
jgi:choline dehydrogenase